MDNEPLPRRVNSGTVLAQMLTKDGSSKSYASQKRHRPLQAPKGYPQGIGPSQNAPNGDAQRNAPNSGHDQKGESPHRGGTFSLIIRKKTYSTF